MTSLNEDLEDGKELGKSLLDSKVFHATRGFFVLLLKEAGFYMNNPTKSKKFLAPNFYRFGGELLRNLYNLFEKFNELI